MRNKLFTIVKHINLVPSTSLGTTYSDYSEFKVVNFFEKNAEFETFKNIVDSDYDGRTYRRSYSHTSIPRTAMYHRDDWSSLTNAPKNNPCICYAYTTVQGTIFAQDSEGKGAVVAPTNCIIKFNQTVWHMSPPTHTPRLFMRIMKEI